MTLKAQITVRDKLEFIKVKTFTLQRASSRKEKDNPYIRKYLQIISQGASIYLCKRTLITQQ